MIFNYSLHAPVIFGAGTVRQVGEKVKELGCKRALCICDEGVKNAGILGTVLAALEESGIETVVYDKVLADPPAPMVDEVGALVRECGADCVVGVGGGSSMDTAKAASVLYKHPGSISDYLNFSGPPYFLEGGLPVILLPTTAGTGSEATPISVISHLESNTKTAILTGVTQAIIDPELCRSAPPSVTANGGLDAFAHAAEAVTANRRTPFSELFGLAAIERIAKYLPRACRDGNDIEARSELSLAANWAGISFGLVNIHVGHAAADSISAGYHTPHGLNCAWATPAVMELCAETVPDKVALVGKAVGVAFSGDESHDEIGQKTGDAIRALMRECGVPTLKERGLDRETVLSGASVVAGKGFCANCPTVINDESAGRLLAIIYDGYK